MCEALGHVALNAWADTRADGHDYAMHLDMLGTWRCETLGYARHLEV